jgi:acyl-CoA thioester hydrolase
MGVTYHAYYLVWFEVGRTDWLRHLGWTYREMEGEGFQLPVIEVQCRYLAPARYDDELEVHTRASLLTPARIRFDYEVKLVEGNGVAATGHTIHAVIGTAGKPCRVPNRVREALMAGGGPARPPGRRDRLQ